MTLSSLDGGNGTYKGVVSDTKAVTSPATGWKATSGKSTVTVTGDLGGKGTVDLVFTFKVNANPTTDPNPDVPITASCTGFTQTGVAKIVPDDVP